MRSAEGAASKDAARRRSRAEAVGTLAVSASNGVRFAVQLALLPVLARLIGPAEYGLVALAIPFILFCTVIADGGFGAALARQQSVSRETDSTVFWLTGAFSLALAGVMCAAAWPIAWILHQPKLPPLIFALSPIMVMSGLTAATNAQIMRTGRFAVFAGGDLVSTLVSGIVAVLAALKGWGAWSIVAQQLTLWTVKLLWVNFGSRLRIGFVCRPHLVADLLRFGGHSVGSGLADFATRNVDKLIVGAMLGTLPLGFYAMAYQIIRVPDFVISGPVYLFVFSRTARNAAANELQLLAQTALAAMRCTAIALAPVFGGLALIAPLAIPLLLGEEWRGLVSSLQILSIAGFGFCMGSVFAATLMGAGHSGMQLRLSIFGSVLTIAGVALAARLGLEAVAIVVSLATVVVAVVYLQLLSAHLRVRKVEILAALTAPALGVAGMFAALEAGGWALAGLPPVPRLVLLIGLGAAAYILVVAGAAWRSIKRDLRLLTRGMHGDAA